MGLAKRIVARWLQAKRIKWKRNVAEGKHTRAEVSKGMGQSWEVEVSTNWTPRPRYLDSDGTIYKSEAFERGEEMIAKWDKEIEDQGRDRFE